MSLLQTTLIIVLVILTINLIVVGIYVVLVLKEFRETVKKANEVLDNVQHVSGPVASLAGILTGFSQSVKAVKSISSLLDKQDKG